MQKNIYSRSETEFILLVLFPFKCSWSTQFYFTQKSNCLNTMQFGVTNQPRRNKCRNHIISLWNTIWWPNMWIHHNMNHKLSIRPMTAMSNSFNMITIAYHSNDDLHSFGFCIILVFSFGCIQQTMLWLIHLRTNI